MLNVGKKVTFLEIRVSNHTVTLQVAKKIIARELLERMYLHAQRLPVGAVAGT